MDTDWKDANTRIQMVIIIALMVLAVALLGRPSFAFYTVLRWVECAASVVLMRDALKNEGVNWALLFVLMALVFNPILPLGFSRTNWLWIDALSAFALVKYSSDSPRLRSSHESAVASKRAMEEAVNEARRQDAERVMRFEREQSHREG